MADNEGHRTDYLYDAVGRLTGIWAPNNDNTPRQRLVSVKANLRSKLSAQRGRSHYVAFVFDAGGRLTEKWFPNGVNAQYTWNNDNTLAQVRNRFNYSDNFVVSQHDYTYNGVGQRQGAQDKLGIYAPPAMNETYAYDPLGNRTTKNDGSSPLYYVYDAANQLKEIRQTNASGTLLTAMVYDDNGNLTQKCEGGAITQTPTSCTGASVATLTYDALNQLTQVNKNGQASQYAYDDAGRRIKKTVNGNATNYLYNGPDIQAEYQNWNQANASYTHGPNTDDPIIRVTAANDANYFHQDGLGSVVATTDLSGNLTAAQLYDAWGKPQPTASLGNLGQYGYTGREPDETGMMYYRARYYDPAIGRFTQRDPIGFGGGINQYAYVSGDPVNGTDPGGNVALFDNAIAGAANVGIGWGIAKFTGQNYSWKSAAIDFGIGFATNGIATLAAASKLRSVATSSERLADARQLGRAGEAGIVKNTERIPSASKTAEYRIPDILDRSAGVIGEVKNVAKQSYTRQLRDTVAYAKEAQLEAQLIVRTDTQLTRPLQAAVDAGDITLIRGLESFGVSETSTLSTSIGIDLGYQSTLATNNANGGQGLGAFASGSAVAPYSGSQSSGLTPGSIK
jgi:RHS repeat-associated protein